MGLFVCAVLAGACSSSDPAAPPLLKNPPSRDTQDSSTGDASTPNPNPDDGGTPSGTDSGKPQKITHWSGTLDASPTVQFGGKNACLYSVTMKNIQADLFIDDTGNGIDGAVQAFMEEKTVGECQYAPQPANLHTYTKRSSTNDGGDLHMDFDRGPDNKPKATLAFDGTLGDSELTGKLTWHRIDQSEQFNWTVEATIKLTPSSQ